MLRELVDGGRSAVFRWRARRLAVSKKLKDRALCCGRGCRERSPPVHAGGFFFGRRLGRSLGLGRSPIHRVRRAPPLDPLCARSLARSVGSVRSGVIRRWASREGRFTARPIWVGRPIRIVGQAGASSGCGVSVLSCPDRPDTLLTDDGKGGQGVWKVKLCISCPAEIGPECCTRSAGATTTRRCRLDTAWSGCEPYFGWAVASSTQTFLVAFNEEFDCVYFLLRS